MPFSPTFLDWTSVEQELNRMQLGFELGVTASVVGLPLSLCYARVEKDVWALCTAERVRVTTLPLDQQRALWNLLLADLAQALVEECERLIREMTHATAVLSAAMQKWDEQEERNAREGMLGLS
jgi:hypothetical protein